MFTTSLELDASSGAMSSSLFVSPDCPYALLATSSVQLCIEPTTRFQSEQDPSK